ncbi:proline-rich protein HaeIII subfamily 1-like [Grammomys surdaster]|uniref:proline-rich protein HaeIII subfamily 1-like n=1 Tax=Grammomys surdaster TaxID=491861 RepID=UPI00109FC483|nr:proline-rich protein HaeIII subfamily 1-like [Grammomys surdaster]
MALPGACGTRREVSRATAEGLQDPTSQTPRLEVTGTQEGMTPGTAWPGHLVMGSPGRRSHQCDRALGGIPSQKLGIQTREPDTSTHTQARHLQIHSPARAVPAAPPLSQPPPRRHVRPPRPPSARGANNRLLLGRSPRPREPQPPPPPVAAPGGRALWVWPILGATPHPDPPAVGLGGLERARGHAPPRSR